MRAAIRGAPTWISTACICSFAFLMFVYSSPNCLAHRSQVSPNRAAAGGLSAGCSRRLSHTLGAIRQLSGATAHPATGGGRTPRGDERLGTQTTIFVFWWPSLSSLESVLLWPSVAYAPQQHHSKPKTTFLDGPNLPEGPRELLLTKLEPGSWEGREELPAESRTALLSRLGPHSAPLLL